MPGGTFVVDSAASFSAALLMASAPREEFGKPGVQEYAKDGTPKWSCTVAVTFTAVGNMPPQSDILQITVTQSGDPSLEVQPGTPVTFEALRVGASAPERKENGRISGGRMWYQASGIKPAQPAQSWSKKSDAA